MINFMAWWVRKHSVHDRKLRLYGKSVDHGQEFNLYKDPAAGQELFLKKKVVIYRLWQGFPPKS